MTRLGAKCPTGCGRPVEAGKLMCRPCWARVPVDLQSKVYATWRAWRKNLDNADLRRAYRSARDNAIAAIA